MNGNVWDSLTQALIVHDDEASQFTNGVALDKREGGGGEKNSFRFHYM